jgi:HEAT repeat protein
MKTDVLRETLLSMGKSSEYAPSSLLYHLSGLERRQMEEWDEVWPKIHPARRTHIIRRLVELAEDDFAVDFNEVFRRVLDDPEPEVRAQAIEGLWEDERPDLVEPLLERLDHDPSVRVQAAAASSLGRYVLLGEFEELDARLAQSITEALLKVIASPRHDPVVRRRAVESVSFSSDARIREVIHRAYNDPDERMQASALLAMGRSADPYWQGTVVLELDNPNPEMRYEAAWAAGELETPLAVRSLIRLVDDPDREVQEAAIWALGQIGGDEARAALIRCCQSEDELVAEAAEEALLEIDLFDGLSSLGFLIV